ncbi:hypothetical protein [Pseudoalteromonas obscura]|uniref:Cache domain-containing protein n=1 Tax=Pseudoalteromonas obscura TaxID=3048491 RepID=A0ABT7EL57_9GAMM|nr:hypothetical protein [Pseudoalteromonas sp. P94(2023)]MDK2595781.1 hypothetical protein [Pseudoalteromonas sp. P94(2023)]
MLDYLIRCNRYVGLLLLILLIYLVPQYFQNKTHVFEQKNTLAYEETLYAAKHIERQIAYLIEVGDTIKSQLSDEDFSQHDMSLALDTKVKRILTHTLQSNKHRQEGQIFAVGVSLDKQIFNTPGAIASDQYELKSWYAFQSNNQIQIKPKNYDYTQIGSKKTQWYTKAVEQGRAIWQEPKFSSTSGAYIIGYSIPFFTDASRSQVAGVISLNYSLTELKSIMRARHFWKTGYGFVVSEQGNLIYHPNEQLAKQEVVLTNGGVSQYASKKDVILACYLRGGACFTERLMQRDAQAKTFQLQSGKAKVFSKLIAHTNWQLHVVFMTNELGYNAKELHRMYVNLVLVSTLFAINCIIGLYFKTRHRITTPSWLPSSWLFVGAISMSFMVGLALIAKEASVHLYEHQSDSLKLTDEQDVSKARARYLRYSDQIKQHPAQFVKTGILVRSIEYQNLNELVISGYIWQKYDLDGLIEDKQKGVVFADAVDGKLFYRFGEHHYRDITHNTETLGWYFKVVLPLAIDHSYYPFDSGTVSLRLKHLNMANNIVLEPDLNAYPLVYHSAKPGLNTVAKLTGWDIANSYFSLRKSNYETDFGISNYIDRYNLAELYFNVSIKRAFINPLITHVAPMMMVFVILFLLLILSTANQSQADVFGFNPMAVITGSSALMFSTMLWHSTLRGELNDAGINYYESYYFLAYLALALVTINSVLLSRTERMYFIHHKDNLLPRLFYWPFLSCALFFITYLKLG